MASERRSADSRASKASTTTLSPLSDGSLRRRGGLGSDRGRRADGASGRAWRGASSAGEGGVDVTPLNVGESDRGRS